MFKKTVTFKYLHNHKGEKRTMAMEKIIECVPNFSVSEAKDKKTFDAIIDCFRDVEGVKHHD